MRDFFGGFSWIEIFKASMVLFAVIDILGSIPIIAGAGSMTSIISLRAEYHQLNIFIAIFINILLVFVVLKLTKAIEKIMGKGGIAILQKVFGIILLAIAVRLFSENAKELFM